MNEMLDIDVVVQVFAVGDGWITTSFDQISHHIMEEIWEKIIEENCDLCAEFTASNGRIYRWFPFVGSVQSH